MCRIKREEDRRERRKFHRFWRERGNKRERRSGKGRICEEEERRSYDGIGRRSGGKEVVGDVLRIRQILIHLISDPSCGIRAPLSDKEFRGEEYSAYTASAVAVEPIGVSLCAVRRSASEDDSRSLMGGDVRQRVACGR
ncbi:uncharacterized protein [Aristolochia californica]|uniref:uncharacterized protein n=1 Tax=Aristolochia californica TaxID=171875 RepID=UPI0035DB8B9C